jgi:glycosyltransferase involved in cell wall biosynthesis
MVAMQLKVALGLPFVVTFHALGLVRRLHQGAADEFPSRRIGIEREIIDMADAIIAECPDDRRNLVTLYNAQPHKISVIPCGFATDEFWPIAPRFARRALGLPGDVPVLLSVGRLVPRKGVDNVIRALSVLVRRLGVPAELLVVGGNSDIGDPATTPEIGRLRAVAAEAGVADRVTFTGRRSRELLKLYYSAADVLVTTPWYEPFGMTSSARTSAASSTACSTGSPDISCRPTIRSRWRKGSTRFAPRGASPSASRAWRCAERTRCFAGTRSRIRSRLCTPKCTLPQASRGRSCPSPSRWPT